MKLINRRELFTKGDTISFNSTHQCDLTLSSSGSFACPTRFCKGLSGSLTVPETGCWTIILDVNGSGRFRCNAWLATAG